MTKTETIFDKIKEQLISKGWTEQECGTFYLNGEYATTLYSKDESKVIHISYNTCPDIVKELIESLKEEDEHVTLSCPECNKVLFKGNKNDAKRLIIYCTNCAQA